MGNIVATRMGTQLCKAAAGGDEAEIRQLLGRNANIDEQDENGYTALMCAAMNQQPAVVQLLIERNASLDMQDNAGRTALDIIKGGKMQGHQECQRLLEMAQTMNRDVVEVKIVYRRGR